MAAPKNNQFWKLRSKHGRDKIFATPEILWEAACEYFDWCQDNPLIEIDFRGKDAIEVEIPKMRPFTIQGLCLFLGVNSVFLNEFEVERLKNVKEDDKDFCKIITLIKETIYNQKFTGAACGFLNANLISRDLGLADKKEIDATVKSEPLFNIDPLADELPTNNGTKKNS